MIVQELLLEFEFVFVLEEVEVVGLEMKNRLNNFVLELFFGVMASVVGLLFEFVLDVSLFEFVEKYHPFFPAFFFSETEIDLVIVEVIVFALTLAEEEVEESGQSMKVVFVFFPNRSSFQRFDFFF